MQSIGTVAELWRYPVKSMQGEQVTFSHIDECGLLGDRAYAILDTETGFIASAKHPRKWAGLLSCRARYAEEPQPNQPLPSIWITLPDGRQIHSAQPDCDAQLSAALGRSVRLVSEAPAQRIREANRAPVDQEEELIREESMAAAAPDGTFFDHAPLHVLSTDTLAQLQLLQPGSNFATRRFRPNLLINPSDPAQRFIEQSWLGQSLSSESGLSIYLIDPSPRCVITTLAQADLPADRNILRTLAQHTESASVTIAPGHVFSAVAGVYAQIRQPGPLRPGDALKIDKMTFDKMTR